MSYFILGLLAIVILLAVMALVRERRIRRALQQVLRRLLERMRHDETNSNRDVGVRDDDGVHRRV